MTSPPRAIRIECPRCQHTFETTFRPSWNRDLDPISDEELVELTSATCPGCSTVIALDTLVVDGDVWTVSLPG